MAEIEVAVFTFDTERELTFVNRAGARLLAQPAERMLGRRAAELGLEDCLTGDAPRVINTAFPGGVGRWEIRTSARLMPSPFTHPSWTRAFSCQSKICEPDR